MLLAVHRCIAVAYASVMLVGQPSHNSVFKELHGNSRSKARVAGSRRDKEGYRSRPFVPQYYRKGKTARPPNYVNRTQTERSFKGGERVRWRTEN